MSENETFFNEESQFKVPENLEETVSKKEKKEPGKVGTFVIALLALVAFLGIQVVISGVASIYTSLTMLAGHADDMDAYMEEYKEYVLSPAFLTPITVICQIVTVAVMGLWYYFGVVKKTEKETKNEIYKKVFTGKTFATAILLGVGFYGIDIIVANVTAAIYPASAEAFNELISESLDISAPLSWFAVVILAPIGEELTFRGVALCRLKKKYSKWAAIIITVIFFSIAHMNILQSVYAIPIAIILGYVAYRYNSIIPAIIIHLVNNLVSSLMTFVSDDFLNSAFAYGLFLAFVAVGIGGAYALQKDNLKKTA